MGNALVGEGTPKPDPVQHTQQQPSSQIQPSVEAKTSSECVATFAGGCFWGLELLMQRQYGVTKTAVGFMGGTVSNPSYRQVCSGETGHTEVVQLAYDPSEVSYEDLLTVFWEKHDPYSGNRQGNDEGTQYRAAIFWHTEEQQQIAQAFVDAKQARTVQQITTQVQPSSTFWPAEEYHQQYLEKGGQSAAKGETGSIRCYG